MLQLIPMTEAELAPYLEHSIADYAQQHAKIGNWSAEEALEKATAEFQKLLPQGIHTPEQHLFMLQDSATKQKVGVMWWAEHKNTSPPSAFICDFLIYEQFQGQGYGTQAMQAVEKDVKAHGFKSISLHVFGHNERAIALYRKVGYEITNLIMAKSLDSKE